MRIEDLNAADCERFVDSVGFAFEGSPWIARRAWKARPFRNVADLHACLMRIVREASRDEQIGLIAAHPDLAGRLARDGSLSQASREEQRVAGLERVTPDEAARFDELNAAYRTRFGFPFVICARQQTRASILSELERRAGNERADEIAAAVREIEKIARLRLLDAIEE